MNILMIANPRAHVHSTAASGVTTSPLYVGSGKILIILFEILHGLKFVIISSSDSSLDVFFIPHIVQVLNTNANFGCFVV